MVNTIVSISILFVLLSLGGGIFLYMGILFFREARKRQEEERVRATATVVDIASRQYTVRDRRGKMHRTRTVTTWVPVVEFTVDGKTYRLNCTGDFNKEDIVIGSSEDILYDPDDPSHFHLEREKNIDYFLAWPGIIIGIALLIFAVRVTVDLWGKLGQ